MIYKISPCLPAGRLTPLFQRGGKKGRTLLKRGREKKKISHPIM